jgi:chromosome segregation ATPase
VDTVTLGNATAKNAQTAQDNKEHLKQLAAILRTLERSMNRESKTVKEELDRVERELKLVRRLDSRMEILESNKDDLAGRFAELTDVLESVRNHIVSGGERALPAEYERLEKERSKLERRLDDVVAHITKIPGK